MARKPKKSRREALRAFSAEQKPKISKKAKFVAAMTGDLVCRRMTAGEMELSKTAAEVAAEFRWAESLRRAVEELVEFRGNGGRVN